MTDSIPNRASCFYARPVADPNQRSTDALREFNRGRILDALSRTGSATRAEIGATTGLARSTVTDLVGELLAEQRLLDIAGDQLTERRAGRPSRRLVLAPTSDLSIGIDFGHSHCRTGVIDALGRVLAVRSAILDVDSSPVGALERARAMVAELLSGLGTDRHRVVGAAIGLPAPVNTVRGTVGPGNVLPQWVDRHPADELQAALELPVQVENDANLGALGEMAFGAARSFTDVIYVKASTGIGAGLVLGGRLYRGSTGRAGEIGHVPIDPAGAVCRCGNRGCLESVASVTQVLAMLQPAHEETLTMTRLAELVRLEDAGANRVLGDAGRLIGRVLADMVNNLNPGVVVLGGELALAGEPLLVGVRDSLDRFAQPDMVRDLAVRIGTLAENAQLIGAGALVLSPDRSS
ncbi:MAG: hypothetical protein QOE71_1447 [Pseudonocardiales bacterium]|nr:hypothetical protein [Pseudonocardiales bacterium]